jgi:hypothetical protein
MMKSDDPDESSSHVPTTRTWQSFCTPDSIIRLAPLLKSVLAALETVVKRAPIWGNAILPTRASLEPFKRVSELVRILGLEGLDPSGPVAVDARISTEFARFGEPAWSLVDGLLYDLFSLVFDLKAIGLCDWLACDGKIPIPPEATMAKLRDVTHRYEILLKIITSDQPPSRWDVEPRIIETLRHVGQRRTTTKLLGEMSKRGLKESDSTVKKRLAEMVKDQRLTKDPKANPPGYGLPEWETGSSGA